MLVSTSSAPKKKSRTCQQPESTSRTYPGVPSSDRAMTHEFCDSSCQTLHSSIANSGMSHIRNSLQRRKQPGLTLIAVRVYGLRVPSRSCGPHSGTGTLHDHDDSEAKQATDSQENRIGSEICLVLGNVFALRITANRHERCNRSDCCHWGCSHRTCCWRNGDSRRCRCLGVDRCTSWVAIVQWCCKDERTDGTDNIALLT